MKVSIVIPVYNVEQYIERCLLSVFNQSYQDIEVIIVDDCGVDRSMDIARRVSLLFKEHLDIKFIRHEKNRGLSAGRNTGIDEASGEYIYFLDSDDVLTLDCIELMVQSLSEKKCDFVIGDHEIIGADSEHRPKLTLDAGVIEDNKTIQRTFYNGEWNMNAWNKLVNLKFLKSNNLYFKEGLIHEDDLWSFYLANTASSMKIVKDKTYKHYIRENSIMTSLQFDTTLKHRSVIINCLHEYVVSHLNSLDSSVFNYIEIRKLILFSNGFFSRASLKKLYEAYEFIRSVPSVDRSNLSMKSKIWLLHVWMPIYLGFMYCILLCVAVAIVNLLRRLQI